MSRPCNVDLRCCRSAGHSGDHVYPDPLPPLVSMEQEVTRLRALQMWLWEHAGMRHSIRAFAWIDTDELGYLVCIPDEDHFDITPEPPAR